jgi:hypothetical protein
MLIVCKVKALQWIKLFIRVSKMSFLQRTLSNNALLQCKKMHKTHYYSAK